MHRCYGQGWEHRETSSFWDAWKAQHDDGLSKETTASSVFGHWTRPTNMQSPKNQSAGTEASENYARESCKIVKREFSSITRDLKVKASCILSFSKASVCVDMLRPIYPLCSLSTAVPWWCKIYCIFSNLIRTSFCQFLKRKKTLVRGSNPHLSFNRPLPTRQTDWIITPHYIMVCGQIHTPATLPSNVRIL